MEPRNAVSVDSVLNAYTTCIDNIRTRRQTEITQTPNHSTASSLTGALMLCVVGGKLSEGINFADQYGRGVVMVGLPYPQWQSPELQEKMRYLQQNTISSTSNPLLTVQADAGKAYYENLCMRAVNQSIGRVIRHAGDYAVIVLLDHRYARSSIRAKLPQWLAESSVQAQDFGECARRVATFFREKREKQ